MGVLRFMTAGESHGPCLVGILDGLPAGLPLAEDDLRPRLARRRGGYGRGARMKLEEDEPRIVGGTWRGLTTGAPLGVVLENASNRAGRAAAAKTIPRPGHADLAGMLKYHGTDANPVLERASARETAMRVALGAAACVLLERFGVRLVARVVEFGGVAAGPLDPALGPDAVAAARDASPVACCDPAASAAMVARVDEARAAGETLGGRIELVVTGLPPGLGAAAQWDRRLDGRLGQALLSIPSAKEAELGDALAAARGLGGAAHDPIVRRGDGLARGANRAGGLEGGMTNGEPLVARATFKPIATLRRGLPSVDLATGEETTARYVRSDVGVVPAATVVAEAVAALVLADAFLEKFGGDHVDDVAAALDAFRARAPRWGRP